MQNHQRSFPRFSHFSTMETTKGGAAEAAEAAKASAIKSKRATWLLDEKLGLCIECERLVKAEKKMLMKEYCRMVKNREGRFLQPSQLRRWTKNIGKIREALDHTKKKKTKVTTNKGRQLRLEPYKGTNSFVRQFDAGTR